MPVWTATAAARRPLQFHSFRELQDEVCRIMQSDERGEVRTTGNWTAGQIFQHVGRFIEFSLDGFPFRVSWPTRLFCTVLKWISWRHLLWLAFRPGYPLPAAALAPGSSVTVPEGAAYLLDQLERVDRGHTMTQPSPFEGRITHAQWVEAHLRHAELHFSFIHYGPSEG
jgi:hypothetical protein